MSLVGMPLLDVPSLVDLSLVGMPRLDVPSLVDLSLVDVSLLDMPSLCVSLVDESRHSSLPCRAIFIVGAD